MEIQDFLDRSKRLHLPKSNSKLRSQYLTSNVLHMPKLNPIDTIDRIYSRIEQLERGDALDAREINSLLTAEQQQAMKNAWAEQQELRARFNTRNAAEKAGIIWKTIRDVRLEACRTALKDALDNFDAHMEQRQEQRDIRAARIYLDAYFGADGTGRNKQSTANNALVRAKLKRPDRSISLPDRDGEVQEMEAKILKHAREHMTAEEREQLELLEEYERKHPKAY